MWYNEKEIFDQVWKTNIIPFYLLKFWYCPKPFVILIIIYIISKRQKVMEIKKWYKEISVLNESLSKLIYQETSHIIRKSNLKNNNHYVNYEKTLLRKVNRFLANIARYVYISFVRE